jgi:hypothetical protein
MTLKTSNKRKTILKGCPIYEKKEIALDFRYVKPSDIVKVFLSNIYNHMSQKCLQPIAGFVIIVVRKGKNFFQCL